MDNFGDVPLVHSVSELPWNGFKDSPRRIDQAMELY